jgi:hypothetical protein
VVRGAIGDALPFWGRASELQTFKVSSCSIIHFWAWGDLGPPCEVAWGLIASARPTNLNLVVCLILAHGAVKVAVPTGPWYAYSIHLFGQKRRQSLDDGSQTTWS